MCVRVQKAGVSGSDSVRRIRWCARADAAAERRLVQLEALCRQKEEERVELELQLTRVKENLNKSLARGATVAPPTTATQVAKTQCEKMLTFPGRTSRIPPLKVASFLSFQKNKKLHLPLNSP